MKLCCDVAKDYRRATKLRPAHCIIRICIALLLSLIVSGSALANVVTLDVPGRTAACDSDALEPKGVRVQGEQVGLYIQNATLAPQAFTLKVSGLRDESYDIYINSKYTGARTGRELQEGLEMSVPGTIADPAMMHCLKTLQPKAEAYYETIRKNKEPEHMRVSFIFGQATDWIRSGIRNEKSHRSTDIMMVPAGKVLQKMVWMTRLDAASTARAITRACWLLQQARDRIHSAIKDPDLRNSSLVALSPVEFTVAYSVKNGKGHVEAALVNDCNLPISGDITMALPKGWKTTAKTLAFKDLKSGEAFKLSFDLTPAAAGAAPPESLPIAANATMVQDQFKAQFKLKTTAAKNAPAAPNTPGAR